MRFNLGSVALAMGMVMAVAAPSQLANAASIVTFANSAVINYAHNQLGKPYCYGGNGPSCFDAAGLTQKAWAAAGVSLPRTIASQYGATHRVSRSDLSPGDVVFFNNLGHVGIYVGSGFFIHALSSAGSIKTSTMSSGYYSSVYYGAGRP